MPRKLSAAADRSLAHLGYAASAAGLAVLGVVWILALPPMALLAGGAAVVHALRPKGLRNRCE